VTAGGFVNSQIASLRSKTVVVRNSRILLGFIFFWSIASACLSLCMLLLVGSIVFPTQKTQWNVDRIWSAVSWFFGAFFIGQLCPFLWKMGSKMRHCRARMDEHGVEFHLGTKKKPVDLFMTWEAITSIRRKRLGNAYQFTVAGRDGSMAQYTSYTFFRPTKVARLIAERTGLTVEKI
jgi:hypothetical protein